MPPPARSVLVRNLANAVSVLGVLPVCVLFLPDGERFIVPFIIFNNVMDDLDGIVATKLRIQSAFGATLDNVCDCVAHTVVVLLVAMWHGGICAVLGPIAAAAIWIRVASRIAFGATTSAGSPTNELMRHVLLVLLLADAFSVEPALALGAVFAVHAVSMLLPYRLPGLIRSLTTSVGAIALVNVALILAWLVPYTAPAVAAAFGGTYLYGVVVGGRRRKATDLRPEWPTP